MPWGLPQTEHKSWKFSAVKHFAVTVCKHLKIESRVANITTATSQHRTVFLSEYHWSYLVKVSIYPCWYFHRWKGPSLISPTKYRISIPQLRSLNVLQISRCYKTWLPSSGPWDHLCHANIDIKTSDFASCSLVLSVCGPINCNSK